MRFDVLTLFPDMFKGPFDESIIKRAETRGLAQIHLHQLRDWTEDRHQTVDNHPYGGGVGMLLKIEPIYKAITELKGKEKKGKQKVILMDAGGQKFDQKKAKELSELEHIILIAGHYEGVDQRVRDHLIDEELSIGDYVLTGGELPAMVVIDSVVRLIPGVLTKEEATRFESHSETGVVEYPQYTRPEDFNGWKVPEILLSGDHKKIEAWRAEASRERTKGVKKG